MSDGNETDTLLAIKPNAFHPSDSEFDESIKSKYNKQHCHCHYSDIISKFGALNDLLTSAKSRKWNTFSHRRKKSNKKRLHRSKSNENLSRSRCRRQLTYGVDSDQDSFQYDSIQNHSTPKSNKLKKEKELISDDDNDGDILLIKKLEIYKELNEKEIENLNRIQETLTNETKLTDCKRNKQTNEQKHNNRTEKKKYCEMDRTEDLVCENMLSANKLSNSKTFFYKLGGKRKEKDDNKFDFNDMVDDKSLLSEQTRLQLEILGSGKNLMKMGQIKQDGGVDNLKKKFQKQTEILKNIKPIEQRITEEDAINKITAKENLPPALISLSKLWIKSKKNDVERESQTKAEEEKMGNSFHEILDRLHEERARREHCEDVIKHMHMKLLDFDERMAVALKVDMNKDQTIGKLHSACALLKEKYESLYEEKQCLEKKSNESEKEMLNLKKMLTEVKRESNQIEIDLKQQNSKLNETVECLRKQLEQEKMNLTELNGILNEKVKSLKEELKLKNKFYETKLDQLKNYFENDQLKLKNELVQLRESNENEKLRICEQYQNQIDVILKDTRNEFNEKFQQLSNIYDQRLSKCQIDVAKAAANYVHQLNQKHVIEMKRMQENYQKKFDEQMKLVEQLTNDNGNLKQMIVKQNAKAEQKSKQVKSQCLQAIHLILNDSSTSNLENLESEAKKTQLLAIEKYIKTSTDTLKQNYKFDQDSDSNSSHSEPTVKSNK